MALKLVVFQHIAIFRISSEFPFQPVTYEEVEKAAKISPLAMSLVKPPDPEMLAGMSVKAQREIMAEHAQKALSQPGSRSGSRPVSRATSVGDLSGETDSKGKNRARPNVESYKITCLPNQDCQISLAKEQNNI